MTMSSVKNIDILLVGNLKTGKTSIINRYVDNKYDSNVERTICFDMRLKHVMFKNKLISLHPWTFKMGQNHNIICSKV
jgi:GTPase SAR1 family protein